MPSPTSGQRGASLRKLRLGCQRIPNGTTRASVWRCGPEGATHLPLAHLALVQAVAGAARGRRCRLVVPVGHCRRLLTIRGREARLVPARLRLDELGGNECRRICRVAVV